MFHKLIYLITNIQNFLCNRSTRTETSANENYYKYQPIRILNNKILVTFFLFEINSQKQSNLSVWKPVRTPSRFRVCCEYTTAFIYSSRNIIYSSFKIIWEAGIIWSGALKMFRNSEKILLSFASLTSFLILVNIIHFLMSM